MADVQWIKLQIGMFDGTSFKKIKRAKIGGERYRDKLTAVWFELMELAGRCNHGGQFINFRGIPYSTIEDIAVQIDRETDELDLCMKFFINEGMVEIINDIYGLTNWEEYQNIEGMEKIREQTRQRVAKHRENKQKRLLGIVQDEQCNVTGNVTKRIGNDEVTHIEREKELELEKELLTFSLARESNADVDNSVDGVDGDDPKDRQREYMRGTLGEGLVFMSQEQFNYLLENYSLDEIYHYFEVIKEQIRMGRRYRKTHFQAIIDMAEKDRKKR